MREVICIAGAHRSGTSMLTRLLNAAGLFLGSAEDLMPAAVDNPDGFWEHLRFVQLNDEILNAAEAAWDLPPWHDESFEDERFNAVRAKARLLISSFNTDSPWGWKDPRNSLTLPFWHSLLPGLKTVVIVRNPLEVAYSMHRRNGTSYALAFRLWEIYNRRLLTHTQRASRIVTGYEAFFERPKEELERLAAFAGLPPNEVAAASAIVVKERRHTTFTTEQLIDTGVSEQIVDLYHTLLAEAAEQPVTVSPSQDKLSAERDHLAGAGSKLNVAIPDGETVRRELATLRGSDLELHAKVENLMFELGQRDGRIIELRERFTQTNQLLHAHSIQLAEREAESVTLAERLRKQLGEIKKLLKLLTETAQAAELLRESRRWKMVNPFAWLGALISGRELRGFGHLDRNVEKYRAWLLTHPEVKELDKDMAALRARQAHAHLTSDGFAASAAGDFKPRPPKKPIEFPSHLEIEVSIIIPVFNQIDYTQACLASIQKHLDATSVEVIVVDDCSTDATGPTLQAIPGLVYVRNETNSGFIASCNHGARRARGSYLLFLNNDTIVTAGWLNALRETFEFEPTAGLVGSKLVYPDGRLQEAGGIIWSDASGWNRGKFEDAAKPEYNFLREVDYCSAACLMIPKSLFETLGGFDSKYVPAYYEDTDLAFKVHASGRKVLYQPLSTVIHYEGATGGTDISAGTKKYQEVNQATFAQTWAHVLKDKSHNGDIQSWDTPPSGCKRILVIDHHVPTPDRDSGSLRMFQILKILHRLGHRLTFLPDNLSDMPPHGSNLRKHGVEVVHHPYINSTREFLEARGREFDVIILSRCDFARKHIADVLRTAPQSRTIFDTVDLHFLRTDREAKLTLDPATVQEALAKEAEELSLVDKTDETWVVSDVEEELLRRKRPHSRLEVVSNIVDVPGSAALFSLRHDFLFIGSFQHTPNIDAVTWFVREIYPLIRRRLQGAKFYIIGDKAPPEVIALADENIVVTGRQPDVALYFNSVKLSIAPLRFGAGVKGKINQSMAFGVPVVATSLAVEGMGLTDREDVLVADNSAAFADAVIELYQSEELWDRLSHHSTALARSKYSPEAAEATLARLFKDADGDNRAAGDTYSPTQARDLASAS